MDVEKIIREFTNKIEEKEYKKSCLTCHVPNLNILHHLQCCLEDASISLDTFCDTPSDTFGKPFMLQRGRLCLKDGMQCIHVSNIRAIIVNLQ